MESSWGGDKGVITADGGRATGMKPVDDAELAREKLATVAVPYFWKRKFAPLAFTVPLLFTIYGFWPMWEKYRAARKMEEQMGEETRQLAEAFGRMARQMGAGESGGMGSLSFGACIIFATVLYLAYTGVMRFLCRS